MEWVDLCGKLVRREEAVVSVFDRGFLYGDAVFETLRSYGGTMFRVNEHYQRLVRSATAIGMTVPFSRPELEARCVALLDANEVRDALLRVTVTRGLLSGGIGIAGARKPTVTITPREAPAWDIETGLKAIVAQTRRIHPAALNPEIKSANYLNNILAKAEAERMGADEAVMLNDRGQVAEGTVGNVFISERGLLKTPAREAGIILGITRAAVLEVAREIGQPLEETLFGTEVLKRADEVFMTGTGYEVMPITEIEGRPVGDGEPGRLTRVLGAGFKALVDSECGGDNQGDRAGD
jgi:branched-chain amino acid aminotransferase